MKGTKHDLGKPMMALLPPKALEQVAMAFTYGANKYGQFNYLGGISYIRILSALLRHTFAFIRKENIDPESGLPHWAHMGACVLMLGEMTYEHPELDDRFEPTSTKAPCNHISSSLQGVVDNEVVSICKTCGEEFVC